MTKFEHIRTVSVAMIAAFGLTAFAAPADAAKSNGKGTEATANDAQPGQSASNVKYCIREEAPTGSIVSKRVCKTREEWAQQGVDVDHPSR